MEDASSSSSCTSSNTASAEPTSSNSKRSLRKSCEACRKGKRKCSGDTAGCAQCLKRGIVCVFGFRKKRKRGSTTETTTETACSATRGELATTGPLAAAGWGDAEQGVFGKRARVLQSPLQRAGDKYLRAALVETYFKYSAPLLGGGSFVRDDVVAHLLMGETLWDQDQTLTPLQRLPLTLIAASAFRASGYHDECSAALAQARSELGQVTATVPARKRMTLAFARIHVLFLMLFLGVDNDEARLHCTLGWMGVDGHLSREGGETDAIAQLRRTAQTNMSSIYEVFPAVLVPTDRADAIRDALNSGDRDLVRTLCGCTRDDTAGTWSPLPAVAWHVLFVNAIVPLAMYMGTMDFLRFFPVPLRAFVRDAGVAMGRTLPDIATVPLSAGEIPAAMFEANLAELPPVPADSPLHNRSAVEMSGAMLVEDLSVVSSLAELSSGSLTVMTLAVHEIMTWVICTRVGAPHGTLRQAVDLAVGYLKLDMDALAHGGPLTRCTVILVVSAALLLPDLGESDAVNLRALLSIVEAVFGSDSVTTDMRITLNHILDITTTPSPTTYPTTPMISLNHLDSPLTDVDIPVGVYPGSPGLDLDLDFDLFNLDLDPDCPL